MEVYKVIIFFYIQVLNLEFIILLGNVCRLKTPNFR